MSADAILDKKAFGIYYTPDALSEILVKWAIRNPTDLVLEPSFGGCGFLAASVSRLHELGCRKPIRNIFGSDIDPAAFGYLSQRLSGLTGVNDGKFINDNFLSLRVDDFSAKKFKVVLGNPPYISLHNMDNGQREICDSLLREYDEINKYINKKASLWAYFLLHSLSFLEVGGRVAWVLPGSILHASYAKLVLKKFEKHFGSIRLIKTNQRFFTESGAKEISVILIADEYSVVERMDRTVYSIVSVDGTQELEREVIAPQPAHYNAQANSYKLAGISNIIKNQYSQILLSSMTSNLDDLLKVRIGTVTGDNSFFVISQSQAKEANIHFSQLRPIISKFSQLSGYVHTKARHQELIEADSRCLLLNPDSIENNEIAVKKYFAKMSKEKRESNKTFKKRKYWYKPDDECYPDAFLSYMMDKGPRIVINDLGINCTNSIHRVYFNKNIKRSERVGLALAMLSSFTQLSAEIEGISYGSGILKLEPSHVKRVSIFTALPVLEKLYIERVRIECMMFDGMLNEATALVDDIICAEMKIPRVYFHNFQQAMLILRNERRVSRAKDDS